MRSLLSTGMNGTLYWPLTSGEACVGSVGPALVPSWGSQPLPALTLPPMTVPGGLVVLGVELVHMSPLRWAALVPWAVVANIPTLPYSHCSGVGPVAASP